MIDVGLWRPVELHNFPSNHRRSHRALQPGDPRHTCVGSTLLVWRKYGLFGRSFDDSHDLHVSYDIEVPLVHETLTCSSHTNVEA